MRGGKSLADRGMIPRLLSAIYRRSKKIEKDSDGATLVKVSLAYFEIYNDKVFDLLEVAEKRTSAGLPLREAANGKTVIVGLTERQCQSLKEFEEKYDFANANRSTSATKLNAHSSRSHAILQVKVSIYSLTETRISTASAIDLAGSEDNRRTGNEKDRMVESASINKSLFVLAQCVEAIGKNQPRVPYRESKMTRLLALGQHNGFTVMILNLAPTKSYHLDTLSSLKIGSRTQKIVCREVENEPVFQGPPRAVSGLSSVTGSTIHRQPLRPLTAAVNINIGVQNANSRSALDKPKKEFSVYQESSKPRTSNPTALQRPRPTGKSSPLKRSADSALSSSRPTKQSRPTPTFIRRGPETLTKKQIDSLVEQKINEILAKRPPEASARSASPPKPLSEEVQRRLENIEQRLQGQEGTRAEGLNCLLRAKELKARGEYASALKLYKTAQAYFPENKKLEQKIEAIESKLKGDIPRRNSSGNEELAVSQEMQSNPNWPEIREHVLRLVNQRNEGDLCKLSGIGEQKAKKIIAGMKLRREGLPIHHYTVKTLKDITSLPDIGKATVMKMCEGLDAVVKGNEACYCGRNHVIGVIDE